LPDLSWLRSLRWLANPSAHCLGKGHHPPKQQRDLTIWASVESETAHAASKPKSIPEGWTDRHREDLPRLDDVNRVLCRRGAIAANRHCLSLARSVVPSPEQSSKPCCSLRYRATRDGSARPPASIKIEGSQFIACKSDREPCGDYTGRRSARQVVNWKGARRRHFDTQSAASRSLMGSLHAAICLPLGEMRGGPSVGRFGHTAKFLTIRRKPRKLAYRQRRWRTNKACGHRVRHWHSRVFLRRPFTVLKLGQLHVPRGGSSSDLASPRFNRLPAIGGFFRDSRQSSFALPGASDPGRVSLNIISQGPQRNAAHRVFYQHLLRGTIAGPTFSV
jgi:hypothetical protein